MGTFSGIFKKLKYYIFFLWVAVILYFYFAENPFPLGYMVASFAGWVFIVFAALGVGTKTKNMLKVDTVTFLEDISVSLGLGLGLLYSVMIIMGVAGLLTPLSVYIMLTLLVLITLKDIYKWISTGIEKWKEHSGNRFSFIGTVFLIILIAGLGSSFLSSISPPTGSYSLSVPLAAAKNYIYEGRLYDIPYNYTSVFSPGMVMLYTLGLLVSGFKAAGLIAFLFIFLIAISVYSMTRKFFHRKIALFATTIIITTPVIFKLYLFYHPLPGSIFFSFMSLYSFICWSGQSSAGLKKKKGWLILAGLFSAFSIGWGYYGLFTPMVILIMVIYKILDKKQDGGYEHFSNELLYFLLPFLIGLLPMGIKNMVITGNPVYPFFAGREASVSATYGAAKSFFGYLLPLWHIPFAARPSVADFFKTGLVYVLFLPAVFLIDRLGKTIRVMLTFVGIYIAVFILVGRAAAYIYTLLPILAIVTAYIIINLYGKFRYFYQAVMGIFIVSLTVNLYIIWPWLNLDEKINFALGYISRSEFKDNAIEGYKAMEYINKNTPPDSKVLLIGEIRTFYIDRKTITSDLWSKSPFAELVGSGENTADSAAILKERGITHLFVNESELSRIMRYRSNIFNDYTVGIYEELTSNYMNEAYSVDDYKIYEF